MVNRDNRGVVGSFDFGDCRRVLRNCLARPKNFLGPTEIANLQLTRRSEPLPGILIRSKVGQQLQKPHQFLCRRLAG